MSLTILTVMEIQIYLLEEDQFPENMVKFPNPIYCKMMEQVTLKMSQKNMAKDCRTLVLLQMLYGLI